METLNNNASRRPLTLSVLALIAVNLLPIGGVLFFDWSVFDVLLLFWAENLIIGAFNVARMVTLLKREKRRNMFFLIPFFCFHYGMFTLVHLIFLLAMFAPDNGESSRSGTLLWPLLGLVVSHGLSFFQNFIGQQEYKHISEQQLMSDPYGRIVIMHITILAGGFVIMQLGEPVYALVLLVALKIVIDVAMHLRSHRRRQHREQVARNIANPEQASRDPAFRGWDDFDEEDQK